MDNDIIKKLAIYDLLDGALEALWITQEGIRVGPDAKFWFGVIGKKRDRRRREFGPDVHDRICRFLKDVDAIAFEPNADLVLLNEVGIPNNIHPGEAALFSATAEIPSFRFVTGDKVCLRGLAGCPECHHIADRIRGHVVCLEQIVLRTLNHYGFEHVRDRIVNAQPCDTSIDKSIFGMGMDSKEESVIEGLHNYINYLREETGNLLLPDPR